MCFGLQSKPMPSSLIHNVSEKSQSIPSKSYLRAGNGSAIPNRGGFREALTVVNHILLAFIRVPLVPMDTQDFLG